MARDVVIINDADPDLRYGVKSTDPRATGKEAGWTVAYEADNTTPYVEPKAEKSAKTEDKG
jgi:hypothetical protein